MEVVIIHRPLYIQEETSIDKGEYYQIFSFKSNPNTTCINISNQTHISVEDAIKGARFGFLELRVYKSENIKQKPSSFKQDNTIFNLSLALFLITSVGLLSLSKG